MNALPGKTSLNQDDLKDHVSFVVEEAMRLGVDQSEVAASHDIGLSATARLGEVESLEYTNDRSLGVTVFKAGKKGSASTSDFSAPALRETVAKAASFAQFTATDEYAGLADAELMARDFPELELDHDWNLTSEKAIQLAIECEDAARAFDKRITNSEGATVGTSNGIRAYANSHGFIAGYPKSSHSVSCVVVGEENGEMERDYWYSAARDAAELESAQHIGETAARRTIGRLGSRKIPTVSAPVLFAPEVARGFIGHAISAIAGSAQYRRSSFLLEAAGQQIFPGFMQIQERPHIPGGMSSAPFDAEGVATADRDLVIDGKLQGYILNSYSARRLGLETTGNAGGAHNLIIPGNVAGMEAILAEMDRGLVVNELIGHGVNAVTGDYSRGVVGYWLENGEIAYPVNEVTIAGNLLDLYKNIVAIGQDQDLRGGIRCGSLLVDTMKIAGA